MKRIFNIVMAVSLTGAVLAEDQLNLKDPKARSSYAVGADIGNSMKRQDLDLDPQALAAGIVDIFAGKSKLTDDEIKAALEDLKGQMMAKMKNAGVENLKKGTEFLAANGKKEGVKTTASGLQYKLLKAGKADGKSPKATDTVKVHYHGTMIDGEVFDSSLKREPVTFPLNGVIPGWTEGLQLMKEGDKFQFVIPPDLAYGEQGRPGIKPNSVLIFEVELLGIEKAN
ncbi:MAG TPA: FKBP-type peptidyl-prolyl cis-trans isomerase [Candidatus Limnocylindria bacterium]|jgi:FKBP-type peptidyl-prolyl cis-trans isomerase|nr:FKBP-type peptidyl-prolyl cis-trans isomerase [Candidatus Limnocylindria bacterium]